MRVIQIIIVALASGWGCASTPPPAAEPARPFIKLANRQMALLVHWRAPAPDPGYRQHLGRALAERLRTTYRVDVPVHHREGAPEAMPPKLLYQLAIGGVDDVVVVDVSSARDGRATASTWVRVLATGTTAHRFTVADVRGRAGSRPRPERLADLVAVGLTERWTDPGAAPPLDPLRLADRLAEAGDCRRAAPLYERELPKRRAGTVVGIKALTESQSRFERCTQELAVARAIAEDQRARYEVRLETRSLSPALTQALQAGLRKARAKARLAGLTHKPVTLTAAPGSLVLRVRYHPERYRAATKGEPHTERGRLVVHLEPFLAAMAVLLDVKAGAVEALPPYERPTLESFRVMLRLEKLPRDYVAIDFAELDGRVLLPDTVRVKVGARPELSVESVLPGVTRTRRLVLGPPRTAGGSPTSYGLIMGFFELEAM